MARVFIDAIAEFLIKNNCKTVLDLGCGHCAVSSEFKGEYPQLEFTGIDLYEKDLPVARQCYKEAIVLDMKKALEHFGENSFDAVISLDTLEHFVPEESLQILKDSESLARKATCHFIPKDACQEHANMQYVLCSRPEQTPEEFQEFDLQAHRCEYNKEDLEKLGYSVINYGEPFKHWLALKDISKL